MERKETKDFNWILFSYVLCIMQESVFPRFSGVAVV